MSGKEQWAMATLGAGCFWCVEAVFQDFKGIEKVISGYTGGKVKNPTYKEICTGSTGHAEVARIYFDPEIISFEEILEIFWVSHDPTTLNRQGADVGTQYRSVIYYHDEEQKRIAEKSRREADESDLWPNPIVTEISPAEEFYEAEDYHQNYYKNHPTQPYCSFVIAPKLSKVRRKFMDKLK